MKKQLIALDYDGTYTADPEFWQGFIRSAQRRGHGVVVVTMRTPDEAGDMCEKLRELCPQIITTERRAKRAFCAAFGVHPTIWIDDMPDSILMGAADAKPLSSVVEQALSLTAMTKAM